MNAEENNLPLDLQHPGGFVEETMTWINETAVCPQPIFALASALCLAGTIFGRHVQDESGPPMRLAEDMHRRGDASEGTLPKATRRARKRVRSPHRGRVALRRDRLPTTRKEHEHERHDKIKGTSRDGRAVRGSWAAGLLGERTSRPFHGRSMCGPRNGRDARCPSWRLGGTPRPTFPAFQTTVATERDPPMQRWGEASRRAAGRGQERHPQRHGGGRRRERA